MNLAPQKTGLVAVAGRQTHGRGEFRFKPNFSDLGIFNSVGL